MVKNNYYFYISGFISLSFFLLVLASFSYMMFSSPPKINSYALNKKEYISVSINTVPAKVKKKTLKKVIKEDITTPETKENVNIDDLFSDVTTKTIKHKKAKVKKIDSKRYNEIAKKVKTSSKNNVKSLSDKVKSMDADLESNNSMESSESSADEVNEYLAKIQATIYNHFYPPQNTQGKSAQIVIELSSIGKMIDFRVLKSSDNMEFNEELSKIKKRLKNIVFPKNPNNENFRLITIITSKE